MADTDEYQPRTAARLVEILRAGDANPRSVQAEAAAKIEEFRNALAHMHWCAICAEGSWEDCDEGRKAEALLAELPQ